MTGQKLLRLLPLLLCACASSDPDGPVGGLVDTSEAGGEDAGGDDGGEDDGGGGIDTGVEWVPGSGGTGDPTQLCRVRLSCPAEVVDEPTLGCEAEVVSGDGVVLFEGVAGVELRGRSSLYFPKPQYGIELREWQSTVLPFGSRWRYWDGASAPGSGWADPDFDDSSWSSGLAPLGYGDPVTTVLSYGSDANNKHITAWFRLAFEVEEGELQPDELQLSVLRDDGVAVYLDGVEVLRDNLAEGAGPTTRATEVRSGADETTPVMALLTGLEPGPHLLAVEVHQADPGSSDLMMDAQVDAIGPEAKVDLFGMGAEADWILNGAYIDRALLRNQLLYDVFQDFEAVPADGVLPAPASRYAAESVYCTLELDGAARGIYVLGERVKQGPDRVDIAKDDGTGQSFIIKLDDRESRGGFHDNAVGYGIWRSVYPREADASPEALDGVRQTLMAWEAAHDSPDPGDPETGVFAYVDLDSAVDWVLLEELSKNNDAYFLSVHMWKDAGGKMHFLPWDMDLTFGYPYTSCHAEDWIGGRQPYVSTMAEIPAFRERLVSRWWELRETVLTEGALLARVDESAAIVAPAMAENVALWPVDEIAFSWGGVDNWLCPVATYEEELQRVRDFIPARLAWMDEHIEEF